MQIWSSSARSRRLAAQELDRTQALLKNGFATKELFDQRKQALDAANAGLRAATEQGRTNRTRA